MITYFVLDYHFVMRIPKNARNVTISESSFSQSYLALRNEAGVYVINGNWRVSWPGKYSFVGTTFLYDRPSYGPEVIHTPGPTNQQIELEVIKITNF